MTQPLALVFYEKLMPGSQLVNRLQDLNYRVQTVNDLASLQQCARSEGPLLVVLDLAGGDAVCRAIAALKADAAVQHIPIIAFASEQARSCRPPRKRPAPRWWWARPPSRITCRSFEPGVAGVGGG